MKEEENELKQKLLYSTGKGRQKRLMRHRVGWNMRTKKKEGLRIEKTKMRRGAGCFYKDEYERVCG
jgi:hypothetical protein